MADSRSPDAACVSYCECYGDPPGSPLCDECATEERVEDEFRGADLFEEEVYLHGI